MGMHELVQATRKEVNRLQKEVASLHAENADLRTLANLVLELADAVDNAAEDIGGSRPQLDILREAVALADSIDAARKGE
jgi:uncharacterized protein YlxW (UPF0749 family)